MIKRCHVCGQEKEHKSWKSTTCNDCLEAGLKWCSSCETVQPISNFHLCRGKPLGMCKKCECKRSKKSKIDNGYYDRPEVKERRSKQSAEWHKRDQSDPERRRVVYDRHNERKRERYHTDADFKESLIEYHVKRDKGITGHLSGDDWKECLEFFGNACAYCGSQQNISRDHIVPVSKGGTNNKNNIVPACRSCNSSKSNKDLEEWYRQYKYFSRERLAKIMKWNGGDAQ